jgi:hypothetical protein
MGRRRRAALVAAAAAALAGTALVACGDGGTMASDLHVEFRELDSGDVRMSAPSAVGAGLVSLHLRNNGASPHQAQLFRVVGERSRAQVLAALRALTGGGARIPSWLRDGGGAQVPPGEAVTVTQRLREGDWYLADLERPRGPGDTRPYFERGGLRPLLVTSGGSQARLPAADATITARDYRFQARGLQPGTQTVRFQNRGRQLHHVVAAPLLSGRTLDEAREYFANPGATGTPPVSLTEAVTLAVVDRGMSLVTELQLERGTYVLACFVHDRAGGPPHTSKGMLQEVKVGR